MIVCLSKGFHFKLDYCCNLMYNIHVVEQAVLRIVGTKFRDVEGGG
jgi:hypothetical protein